MVAKGYGLGWLQRKSVRCHESAYVGSKDI